MSSSTKEENDSEVHPSYSLGGLRGFVLGLRYFSPPGESDSESFDSATALVLVQRGYLFSAISDQDELLVFRRSQSF